jgi:nucleotide-binding universal stress UspA family protein
MLVLSVMESGSSAKVERMKEAAERHLRTVLTRLIAEGVQADAAVAMGRPAEEIVRMAERHGCNLIALATQSQGNAGRGTLGSVIDKVIHASQIPTLAIPPETADQPWEQGPALTSIVVPLDGSPLAETALPYAEDLAQKLAAQVVLMRAVTISGVYAASLGDVPFVDTGASEVGEAEAADYLTRVVDKLRTEGVEVRSEILRTSPAQGIVDLAHQLPQSLIALTTHGRSALARWFIGSVTESVLRAAADPVLVIPQQYSQRYAMKIADLLEQTPLFSELTQEDLASIAEAARVRTYPAGEIIVREGDRAAGCFILLSGKVEVIKGMDTPRPAVLASMGPGEFFGEMAMIDDHPRSATVRAIENTECVALRRSDFMAELRRRPEIAVQMLPVLVRRLREAHATPAE